MLHCIRYIQTLRVGTDKKEERERRKKHIENDDVHNISCVCVPWKTKHLKFHEFSINYSNLENFIDEKFNLFPIIMCHFFHIDHMQITKNHEFMNILNYSL